MKRGFFLLPGEPNRICIPGTRVKRVPVFTLKIAPDNLLPF
jgi:hypothetical protein